MTTTTMTTAPVSVPATIRARVRAGATLLDCERPGWMDRLDLRLLRMWNCYACVLGQIYGDYVHAVFDLNGRTLPDRPKVFDVCGDLHEWAVGHGFARLDESWEDLRTAWLDEVAARRGEEVATPTEAPACR